MIPWLTPDDYFDRYIVTLSPCADYEISNILGDTDTVRKFLQGLGCSSVLVLGACGTVKDCSACTPCGEWWILRCQNVSHMLILPQGKQTSKPYEENLSNENIAVTVALKIMARAQMAQVRPLRMHHTFHTT